MNNNLSAKERWARGEKLLGAWLVSGSALCAEAMAIAGYDCLIIDQEHGAIDLSQLHPLILAMERHSTIPLLRVPALEADPVKRILDMGIENIMFPGIMSVAQVKEMIAACRFPTQGVRGVAPGAARITRFGKDIASYLQDANRRQAIMIQIETLDALRDIDAIAAVPDVSMLFIGPNDLSANLGYLGRADHPDVMAAFTKIEQAARTHKKYLGTVPSQGRSARTLFDAGYQLVLSGADLNILRTASEERIKQERS